MSFISHKQFDFDFELITHLRHKQYKEPHPVLQTTKLEPKRLKALRSNCKTVASPDFLGTCLFIILHGFSWCSFEWEPLKFFKSSSPKTNLKFTCGWTSQNTFDKKTYTILNLKVLIVGLHTHRFLGDSVVNNIACQCRRCKRCRFNPWVSKIPWKRAWQPTPVFLPGKFHGQRSLVGYSLWGHKESDTTEHTHILHTHIYLLN